MFNKIILVGSLTRDIELRYTNGGTALAKTAIASNKKFKKQDGTKSEEVCFVDITFFGKSAEIANQYLRKGSKCLIDGRLMFEQWTDQQGQKRSKHSVTVESMQMLDTKAESQDNSYKQQDSANNTSTQQNYQTQNIPQDNSSNHQPQGGQGSLPEYEVDEDEIPF